MSPQIGFIHAPVTKTLLFSSVGLTLAGSYYPKVRELFVLRTLGDFVVPHRLLGHNLLSESAGHLIVASLLLYNTRDLERRYGSQKYSMFLCVILGVTSMLHALSLSSSWTVNVLPSGLHAFILATNFLDLYSVPSVPLLSIGPFSISSKLIHWIFIGQFTFTSPTSLFGLISALLWISIPPLQSLRFPDPLTKFVTTWILPYIDPHPFTTATVRREFKPNEQHVGMLTGMGFSRENAVRALTRTNGDLEAAVRVLLSGS